MLNRKTFMFIYFKRFYSRFFIIFIRKKNFVCQGRSKNDPYLNEKFMQKKILIILDVPIKMTLCPYPILLQNFYCKRQKHFR